MKVKIHDLRSVKEYDRAVHVQSEREIEVLREKGSDALPTLNFRSSGRTPQTGWKCKRNNYRMPGTETLVQIQAGKREG